MKNSKNTSIAEQGLDYWENELQYFEKSMDGLQTAYSIIKHMHIIAQEKIIELTPEREEVQ